MANIGRNKYGCSFPDGGYVHLYNMMMVNESNNPFSRVNTDNFEQVGSIQESTGFFNKNVIMLMVASAGFILAVSSILGGDTDA